MNYLYNGVELPDINTVWTDKETYPYAFIYSNDKSSHTMRLGKAPFYVKLSSNGNLNIYSGDGHSIYYFRPGIGETEWTKGGTMSNDPFGVSTSHIISGWTSHDILNEDGTLYLAASDPVPVPQLNSAALMQGFFVGQAIRRNRK